MPGNATLIHPTKGVLYMKIFFKVASRRPLLSAVSALVLGTCFASAAQADVNFCNKYPAPVFVSVAYNENGEWISKGWEKIDPGTCRNNPFELHVGQFYYRGETDWIPTPNGGKRQTTWGSRETARFSVVNDGFNFRHAEVPHSGSRQEGFSASFRFETGEVSETITFGADLTTTQQTLPSGI
jgi:uncharacterized membrane protein